jgi:xylulokinase
VLDRRIERVDDPTTAQLRGAGLVAALALGALTDEQAAAAARIDRVFEPDLAAHAVYAPVYAQFRKQYARQKGLASALNA